MTVGGAIWGYCAIGKPRAAISPAITMVMEITAEKIGRPIKKLERLIEHPSELLRSFAHQRVVQRQAKPDRAAPRWV